MALISTFIIIFFTLHRSNGLSSTVSNTNLETTSFMQLTTGKPVATSSNKVSTIDWHSMTTHSKESSKTEVNPKEKLADEQNTKPIEKSTVSQMEETSSIKSSTMKPLHDVEITKIESTKNENSPSTKTHTQSSTAHPSTAKLTETSVQHDETVTPAQDATSIGPWLKVTPDGKLAAPGKHFGRLHRHRSTTQPPSTDLETQLTLEGGGDDDAAQGMGSGKPEKETPTSTTNTPKPNSKPSDPNTEDTGDQPAVKSTETEIEIAEPSEPTKPHFKLIYFDARGICESIRLLFRYANQTFVDERISKKKWIAIKDSTFFGKIPILEVDGKPLAQCYAISRYLARQFGLAGADDWEAAKLDEAADFHKGVHNEISPYIFVLSGYRQGNREALRKDVFIPVVEKNFPIYVNLLKQSSSGFFAKSGVSWVDFVISEYMSTIRFYEPLVLEKFPVIVRFIEKVQALTQIKDYIKQRAKTPLQLQY